MEQVTLSARRRVESGTRPARRMRRDGLIPAVVYGRDLEAVPLTVTRRDLYTVLHTEAGLNAVINVDVEGADTILTVAREIQRHPVRGEITHLDFIKISLDVAIEAEVAIEYLGTPLAVREGGAIVETISTSVMIEALPTAVPSSIAVDISELEMGDTLKIEDLPTLDGVTYVDDLDRPLVTVLLPRVEEEPTVVAEEGEEAEGEAADADEEETGEGDES